MLESPGSFWKGETFSRRLWFWVEEWWREGVFILSPHKLLFCSKSLPLIFPPYIASNTNLPQQIYTTGTLCEMESSLGSILSRKPAIRVRVKDTLACNPTDTAGSNCCGHSWQWSASWIDDQDWGKMCYVTWPQVAATFLKIPILCAFPFCFLYKNLSRVKF